MFPRFCSGALSTLVLFSTLSAGQVLSKSNSGLTNPETIQVTGHANGNVPFQLISSLSAQDVDGDGKADLLVSGPDPTNTASPITTTLLRNLGNQNFQQIIGNNSSYCVPAYTSPATPDQVPPFCMLADLNGDGMPDKVFAGEYTNPTNSFEVDYPYVKVQFATGAGTYAAPQKYALGGRSAYIASLAFGDFNGDGRMDIAALRMSQIPDSGDTSFRGYVFVLYGNAQGTFTVSHSYDSGITNSAGRPVNLTDFFPHMHLASVDLNGDGKSDILVNGDGVNVLFGGTNGLSLKSVVPFYGFDSLAAADLNKDGFGDLIVQDSQQQNPKRSVHVLSGGGVGSPFYNLFARDQVLQTNENDPVVTSIITADFNRDGRLDIAISTSHINIYLQAADGSFPLSHQYVAPPIGFPFLTAADFNGDGKLDLAAAGNPLGVFYGDGFGSFTGPLVTSNFTNFISGNDVVTADFNRDGKPDVATTIQTSCSQAPCATTVNVFAGSGKGWFLQSKNYNVPLSTNTLAAGDVNGDGFTDIIALSSFNTAGSADIGVLLGKADGTFAAAKTYTLGISGTELFLRDLNNDGKLDLVTDTGVALGNGDGTFGQATTVLSPRCTGCNLVAPGDFNGDGKLDLLYVDIGTVHVLIGDGSGHFTEKSSANVQCSCGGGIVAGDLNGDGKLDFAIGLGGSFGGGVATYLGKGDGTFQLLESDAIAPASSAIYGRQVLAVAIHDMNGDGVPDVIGQTTSGMPVFLGKGGGKLTSSVYFAAPPGTFGTANFAIADYNLDGAPDVVVPTDNGFARLLNTGYGTWPKLSALPPPPPFRTTGP